MNRLWRLAFYCLLFGVFAGVGFAQQQQGRTSLHRLRSPNGRIKINFSLNRAGAPAYSVSYDGRALIAPSTLGLGLKQGGMLGSGMTLTGTPRRRAHDETYELVVGMTRRARDRYRELTVSLEERAAPGRKLQLVFRAYDDGVAFRYLLPAQAALKEFETTDEQSEFRFPSDDVCWAMQLRTFHSNYEKEFDKITLSRIKPGAKIGLPLVVQTAGGVTLAIAEANLKDCAGMYLHGASTGEPYGLVSRLSPFGGKEEGSAVRAVAPHASPWRVVMIGDAPGRLVESTILLNLNEPNAIRDPTWIKPGKAAWDWWSGQQAAGVSFKTGMNDATMKHYINFASEMGLEYMLVDAGWYTLNAYGDDADTRADITKSISESER